MSCVKLGKEPTADLGIIDHCTKAVYIQILEHLTTFLQCCGKIRSDQKENACAVEMRDVLMVQKAGSISMPCNCSRRDLRLLLLILRLSQ